MEHAASAPAETGPSPLRTKWRRSRAILREGVIFLCFAAAINQGIVELWSTRDRWYRLIAETNKAEWLQSRGWRVPMQPELFRLLTLKLRFLQGWFMFSPNPVMDDGTIVVDALTKDGRHIDPFTMAPPDFDLPNAKSYGYNQIWSDYFNRIRMASQATYRDGMRAYILRLPQRTGRPEDTIVSGDVWWVQDMNPIYGDPSRKSYAFTKGKRYLIYANKFHQTIKTSVCEPNVLLAEGEGKYLPTLGKAFLPGRPDFARKMNLVLVGLGVGGLLFLAAVVLRKRIFKPKA